MDYKKLGKRIREERKNRNLTQEKLAEAVDISTTYMGQIERGEKSLTLDTLVKIANYFDVTMDYLARDSLKAYTVENHEEWNRLIEGKTLKEKQVLTDVVKRISDLFSN